MPADACSFPRRRGREARRKPPLGVRSPRRYFEIRRFAKFWAIELNTLLSSLACCTL